MRATPDRNGDGNNDDRSKLVIVVSKTFVCVRIPITQQWP